MAARSRDSFEYTAIKKNLLDLKGAVLRGEIPASLFQNDLITLDVYSLATNETVGREKRGSDVMVDVLNAVALNPALFDKFCESLAAEEGLTKDVIEKTRVTLENLRKSPEHQGSEEYQLLKDSLEALNSLLKSVSDEDVELSVKCMRAKLRQYIDNALKSGHAVDQIEADLKSLCDQLVIPTALWPWTTQRFSEAKERLAKEVGVPSQLPTPVKPATPEPKLFCKDTLYHASLCCCAVNSRSLVNVHTYFQNKNPRHEITEVSFSQASDEITPYLIAKQQDILYVAFQGIPFLSKWMDTKYTSFDEGVTQQSCQIPLRFFIEQLNQNKKIVLTGFSFGGMLACCVAAQLWHSTTDRDVLLERVICITFGQPFLQIKMVEKEIEMCPQFEKSIHSIFNKDDLVPLMIGCLDLPIPTLPKVKALTAPNDEFSLRPSSGKRTSRMQPGDLFSKPFVVAFLRSLVILQEYSPQQSKMYSRAHATSDAKKRASNAVEKLNEALHGIAVYHDQIEAILYGNNYGISKDKEGVTWQQQFKHLASIELSQHPELVTLDENLFQQYNMDAYMQLIFRSHLEKPPDKYIMPNPEHIVKDISKLSILKPKIIRLEVHEYPNEHVILLKGENLWFSCKICLDEKGESQCDIDTPADSTTRAMIEFHLSSSHNACSTLHSGNQVKIALYTHFSKPIRQSIDTKKEPHKFSVRQIQLAKHTPTQVIELAYLCALLEQRRQRSISERFKAVGHFLEEVVKVVPLESVFDAIAYEDNDVAQECAEALKKRDPHLLPSELMILGAIRAASRASTGYSGDVLDQLTLPLMYAQTIQFQLPLQVQDPHSSPLASVAIGSQQSAPQSQSRGSDKTKTASPSQPSSQRAHSLKRKEKALSYSDAVASGRSSESEQPAPADIVSAQMFQPSPFIPVPLPLPFPVFLDQFPPPQPFPLHLVDYLNRCLNSMCRLVPAHKFQGIVSCSNIEEVYSVSTRRRTAYFKSPVQVLRDGMEEIAKYTEETQGYNQPETETHNRQMLKLIDKIYKHDVAVCAALLGAFMEQQIRIPLLNSPKATAETLSSKAAPVAVGVWALFSQNLSNLQQMLASSNHSALIVEIKEYIEGIRSELPENEDRMYAGKLQFLLQGIKETVTASSQYISYSLEYQLCKNLKFDKSITLKQLIFEWDKIFENDALSLIGPSHRPLVARWLKWTILVHDLRETLAQHTCIGVTGLVNSGKSLLVKELFKMEKVKVGTRTTKRTTVPLLYNMEESIDGLDVIDFPGVDDSDNTVPELAGRLLSLAQIVVFVVDYRKVCSHPVKVWLQLLTKSGVPVLVCLTYADVLYLECAEEGVESGITRELAIIRKHLKLDAHHTPEVSFYSFKHTSDVSAADLKSAGIKSLVDVGNWLVQILKTRFRQDELAEKLKGFIQSD